MGYTHYWYTKAGEHAPDTFAAFVADAAAILQAERAHVAGPLGEGAPVILADKVSFNGRGDESHETCCLTRVNTAPVRNGEVFDFTKTARKRYDAAVTAVLLAYHHRFPGDVRLASDGYRGDWLKGQAIVASACGYTPEIPHRAADPEECDRCGAELPDDSACECDEYDETDAAADAADLAHDNAGID